MYSIFVQKKETSSPEFQQMITLTILKLSKLMMAASSFQITVIGIWILTSRTLDFPTKTEWKKCQKMIDQALGKDKASEQKEQKSFVR